MPALILATVSTVVSVMVAWTDCDVDWLLRALIECAGLARARSMV